MKVMTAVPRLYGNLLKLIVLFAIACGFAAISGSASAAPPPVQSAPRYGLQLAEKVASSTNPDAAYNALSAGQKTALNAATRPVKAVLVASSGTLPSGAHQAAAGCYGAYGRFDWRAAAGNTVYTTWQGLHWCSNGSSVTSFYVFDRGGETSTPGWSYQGNGGAGSWNVSWEVRQYTQQKFTFGIGAYGYSTTPCTQVRGGATGLYSSRASCNLS